jgi:hypothetical protein
MAPRFPEIYLNQWTLGIVFILILAGIVLLSVTGILPSSGCPVTACSTDCSLGLGPVPIFTSPAEKIAVLKDPAFSGKLYAEALATEPLLARPGTQVHMGFWSGRGNHGSMLQLLDAVNEGPAASAVPPNRAIWDEGTTAYYDYPSYTRILDEHWYERASGLNGSILIFGRAYTDPHPVTFADADTIWGEYSARYTEMAEPISQATGNPVRVWCFVDGAKANRIFYTYDLPALRRMEQQGFVEVFFAKSPNADWTRSEDWTNGTANMPAASG